MNLFARAALLILGNVWYFPILWLGLLWIKRMELLSFLTLIPILILFVAPGSIVLSLVTHRNLLFLKHYLNDFPHCEITEVKVAEFFRAKGDEFPHYLFTLERPCEARLFFVSNPSKDLPGPSQHVAFVNYIKESLLFVRDSPATSNVVAKFWVRHEVGHCRLDTVIASASSLDRVVRMVILFFVTLIFSPWSAFPSMAFWAPLGLWLVMAVFQRLAWPNWKPNLNEEIAADEFAMANTPTEELRQIQRLYDRHPLPQIPNLSEQQNQIRRKRFLSLASELIASPALRSEGLYLGAMRYPHFSILSVFFLLFLVFATVIAPLTWVRFWWLLGLVFLILWLTWELTKWQHFQRRETLGLLNSTALLV